MFQVSERLKNVKVSASAAMTRKVRELRAEGVKIVGLSSGEPDFPTPLHAIEAAYKAALAGDTKYPPQDGVKPLKEAIRAKFKRDNNLDYALEEIMVSNGSKQIMYDALMASVNPGDEVIIPVPAGFPTPTRRPSPAPRRCSCRAPRTTSSSCAPPTSRPRSRPTPNGWC